MSESLNHSLNQFIQMADSFMNEANNSLIEWVIELFTQPIHTNGWFIHEQSKWLSL